MKSPFPFAGKIVLAPMEGVTHPTFRRLMIDQGGLGLVCTEFVRITKETLPAKHLRRQVVRDPRCPLSVQVMGNSAERMAEAAGIVSEAGADVVDINLGCPMPRVVRKGVGAAMLEDLDLLRRVLETMRKATTGLLSAKMRAGFDDSERVLSIAKAIEDAGVDFIAVHPRRRCDFYRGLADWRIIAAIKEAVSIPVIGNGDVWYASDVERMRRETNCDAVMIGRPALRNPFLFEQIHRLERGVSPLHIDGATLYTRLQTMFDAYREYYEPLGRSPLGPSKELLSWVGRSVDDGGAFRSRVLRKTTLEEVLETTREGLSGLSEAELDLDVEGSLGLMRQGAQPAKAAE